MYIIKSINKHFGRFGGRYVPEMLVPALEELESAFTESVSSPEFLEKLQFLQQEYIGRPSLLYFAENLTHHLVQKYGGKAKQKVYLKLEGLNNTGAHKINNVVGQVLLAQAMGKKHIVAETGAGQHGLATAAVCAKCNIECSIFMGEVDMQRQYPNVFAMQQMGAKVIPVTEGTKTLKDAVNAALKYWIEFVDDTHYLIGSALGPHPYPEIVQYFQSIIGQETKEQILEKEEKLPYAVIACVGGGSNSLGIFSSFIDDEVRLIGIEAGGTGTQLGEHAARMIDDTPIGIVQGYKSFFLQNEDGQVAPTHSISAGLDYAGVSPQLAYFHDKKRIEFRSAKDASALLGYQLLARTEGMIPALESAHALGALTELVSEFPDDAVIVVNVSGRGDKDLFIVAPEIDNKAWIEYLSHEIELHTNHNTENLDTSHKDASHKYTSDGTTSPTIKGKNNE